MKTAKKSNNNDNNNNDDDDKAIAEEKRNRDYRLYIGLYRRTHVFENYVLMNEVKLSMSNTFCLSSVLLILLCNIVHVYVLCCAVLCFTLRCDAVWCIVS